MKLWLKKIWNHLWRHRKGYATVGGFGGMGIVSWLFLSLIGATKSMWSNYTKVVLGPDTVQILGDLVVDSSILAPRVINTTSWVCMLDWWVDDWTHVNGGLLYEDTAGVSQPLYMYPPDFDGASLHLDSMAIYFKFASGNEDDAYVDSVYLQLVWLQNAEDTIPCSVSFSSTTDIHGTSEAYKRATLTLDTTITPFYGGMRLLYNVTDNSGGAENDSIGVAVIALYYHRVQ